MLKPKLVRAVTDLGKAPKGGSEARFIVGDDDNEYVVKYMKKQGPRLFINEFIGAFFVLFRRTCRRLVGFTHGVAVFLCLLLI